MTTHHLRRILLLPAAIASVALMAALGATVAQAEPVASKFVLSAQFGSHIDQTTGANICTVASKDTCQPGVEGSEPGGFSYPLSVAVNNDPASPSAGDVYVADEANHRVQVLSATGVFVSMFGWEVNQTKDETPGATQAEKNVCTAESKDTCKAGVRGTTPGQFYEAFSIAVDAARGNVFVAERVYGETGGETASGSRVQEFTGTGTWLLEIGKEVNKTTKANACTETEAEGGATCGAPALIPLSAGHVSEHGAFNLEIGRGNTLAVGGPEDLLYVGDEHRVQEFTAANGTWTGEIPLTSISSEAGARVRALTVDETGRVFLAYEAANAGTTVVRQFEPGATTQAAQFEVALGVGTLSLDPHGRLGVITSGVPRGALYSTAGVKISEFGPSSGWTAVHGLTFAASDELYVPLGGGGQEVEAYAPALFPETVSCAASEVLATSAVLCGEINANGLKSRGFFDYGSPSGARTPVVFEGEGTVLEPFSTVVTGLTPNQAYTFNAVAEAEVAGEEVTGNGEPLSFHTATPPPEVAGTPLASDVTASSAVLSAQVNPEHALALYHFQYGPCPVLAGCAGVAVTGDQESSTLGSIAAIQEAVALQPQTSYSYRLVAENRHEEAGGVQQGGETAGAEGHFATGASPVPVAVTGGTSGVEATSAVISGSVDPDGQPAVYSFELGVYDGAMTQFGVVFSGAAGASLVPVGETLGLSGLQPGATYAYRIVLKSGYGESVGQSLTFTTAGLPLVLTSPTPPALLAIPGIAFPGEATGATVIKKKATPKCKKGKQLRHGKCVKAKGKKAKKGGRKAKKSAAARGGRRGK
jgi:hypothetical protein